MKVNSLIGTSSCRFDYYAKKNNLEFLKTVMDDRMLLSHGARYGKAIDPGLGV